MTKSVSENYYCKNRQTHQVGADIEKFHSVKKELPPLAQIFCVRVSMLDSHKTPKRFQNNYSLKERCIEKYIQWRKVTEVYWETCQTSKLKLFQRIGNPMVLISSQTKPSFFGVVTIAFFCLFVCGRELQKRRFLYDQVYEK